MDKEKQKGEEFPEGAEVLAEIEKIQDPKDPPQGPVGLFSHGTL